MSVAHSRIYYLVAIQQLSFIVAFRRANRWNRFEETACQAHLLRSVLSFSGLDHQPHEKYIHDPACAAMERAVPYRLWQANRGKPWKGNTSPGNLGWLIAMMTGEDLSDLFHGQSHAWENEPLNAPAQDIANGEFEQKRTGCVYCSPYVGNRYKGGYHTRTERPANELTIIGQAKECTLHPSREDAKARLDNLYDIAFVRRMIKSSSRRRRHIGQKRRVERVARDDEIMQVEDDHGGVAAVATVPCAAAVSLLAAAGGGSSRDAMTE